MNEKNENQAFSARKTLRSGLPQFVGFEVLFRLLGAILFTPLVAWLTTHLIELSGSGAISNYELAAFFLSAKGLLYLTAIVTITVSVSSVMPSLAVRVISWVPTGKVTSTISPEAVPPPS